MSNDPFKPRNKVEADIVNAAKLVGGFFGLQVGDAPVQEAVNAARSHVGGIKGTDGVVVDYDECGTCHIHYDASKQCPNCGPPPAAPRKPKTDTFFFCAWNSEGAYQGAFVSPYQAHDHAGEGGSVKRLRAEDIPEG